MRLRKSQESNSEIVFVLSTGRVGSMTFARLLNLSPDVLVKHEPSPKLFRLSKANYQCTFEDSEFSESIFWTVREDLINQAFNSGKGYVETSPQATFFAPVIKKTIPSVKFIHLVRHPADIVTSGMRRNWYGGHPSDNTRITPRSTDKYWHDWSSMNQLGKNAWLWSETNRWIMDFLKAVPDNQQITIRAEDLYNQKSDVIADVFDFVSAGAPSQKRVNKVLSKKHNKQTRGDFPPFKNWTPEMKEQLRIISGEQAKALGYEI
ncbi:sulfotransferase [uncultured Methylophaga sp.]|uniref:sulfotransferase family protein n=1 Tax=uncultured Methylophaga sp. TaxID=285271 RepID=UPI0026021E85|nr:sulfotransferase [uncultured Methylophaga sp.]